MKKILSIFCMLIACTNMVFGQVTISTSDLVGTKWQLTEDYESQRDQGDRFCLNLQTKGKKNRTF